MNETEHQKGRLEALSLIVRAVVTARRDAKPEPLGPTLIRLSNRYLLDTSLDTQTVDFRSGFEDEVKRIVAILDAPVVELSRPGRRSNNIVPIVNQGGEEGD